MYYQKVQCSEHRRHPPVLPSQEGLRSPKSARIAKPQDGMIKSSLVNAQAWKTHDDEENTPLR